ncbi:MAG: tetratricopeptide repeat protein [Thermoanaerobaculia bacterium]|nr:tetratricopeptide repeat protein [Thermoanaerobaculia bacterium]
MLYRFPVRILSLTLVLLFAGWGALMAKDKPKLDRATYQGKDAAAAGGAVLDWASQNADGTWELIALGRVLYLSGDKEAGRDLFDRATREKPSDADWMKIGRVYEEADDWPEAQEAFDKSLRIDPEDEDNLIEIGCYYLERGDRVRAEELFDRSFGLKPESVRNAIEAAGCLLGVEPRSK